MKLWKYSLITAIAFISISFTVLYSSCTHDSCKTFMCRHDGVCVDGFCRCEEGFEGSQCETYMRTKFLGTYDGITKINTEPVIIDSAIVDAYGAEPEIYIQFFLYSRGTLEKYIGRVYNSTEVEVTDVPSGKTVTMDYIGNDRIEILIEETTADGKLSYTQFQGTKRTK